MFRRRGFVELGAFVVLAVGLTFAVFAVLDVLKPLLPSGVVGYLRVPGSSVPIFVACAFVAMAVVKMWSRRHPDPRSGPHPRR